MSTISAQAQAGFAVSGQAVLPSGLPAANARITVCPYTASGTPCAPQATIYSDINLTVPLTQPYSSDQYGNYNFYVTPGTTYLVQIQVSLNVTYPYTVTAESGGGSGTPSAPAYSVQFANPSVTAFTSDPNILINPTTHTFTAPNVGQFFSNPPTAIGTQTTSVAQFAQGFWSGTGYPVLYSGQDVTSQWASWSEWGHNRGNPPVGLGGWAFNDPSMSTFVNRSTAQFHNHYQWRFHYGVGDAEADRYSIWNDWGGTPDASAEGQYLGGAYNGGEDGSACTTTIKTGGGGAGATTLQTNAFPTCVEFGSDGSPAIGDGHFILDITDPIAGGTITSHTVPSGETPETYTMTVSSGAITPSTAQGVLNGDCKPTVTLNGPQTQTLACPVTLTSSVTNVTSSGGSGMTAGTYPLVFGSGTAAGTITVTGSSVTGIAITNPGVYTYGGVPTVSAATGGTPPTLTAIVNSGSFVANGLVSFAGQFYDQQTITSVSGTAPNQTITLPVRQPHESGSWIMQGGTQGSVVFTANIGDGLKYPITVLGATSSTTIVTRPWFTSFNPGNSGSSYGGPLALGGSQAFTIYPSAEVTDVQDAVTVTSVTLTGTVAQITANNNFVAGQPIPFAGITGGAATGLNGINPNPVVLSSGLSSTGFEVAFTGAAGGPYPQTGVVLYPIDGNITINANNGVWPNGGTVEEEHSADQQHHTMRLNLTLHNPGPGSHWSGLTLDGGGAGMVSINTAGNFQGIDESGAFIQTQNNNSTAYYLYWGGHSIPPTLGHSFGQFDNFWTMDVAPMTAVFTMGCGSEIGLVTENCSDPNFSTMFHQLHSNIGYYIDSWSPFTGTMTHKGIDVFSNPQSSWQGGVTSSSGSIGCFASGIFSNLMQNSGSFTASNWGNGGFASITPNSVTGPCGGGNVATTFVCSSPPCFLNGTFATPLAANSTSQNYLWLNNPNGVTLALFIGSGATNLPSSTTSWAYAGYTENVGINPVPGLTLAAFTAGTFYIYGFNIANGLTPSAGYDATGASTDPTPHYGYSPNLPLISGTPTANDCANWATPGQIGDAGAACGNVIATVISGTSAPSATCSSSVNTFAIEINATPTAYQCSNATGSYAWNMLGSGTVSSGSGYAFPAYASGASTTIGPSNIKTDSTGNNLIIPAGGTVTITPDGVHAGLDAIIGNTMVPASFPSNAAGFLGPNSASFTSYFCQLPSAAPANSLLVCGTPASNVSAGSWIPAPTAGYTTLSSGTITISNAAACTPSATCVYKLTNCGINSSAALGVLTVGTTTPGTSFVINSESATSAIVTTDNSHVCWQIN